MRLPLLLAVVLVTFQAVWLSRNGWMLLNTQHVCHVSHLLTFFLRQENQTRTWNLWICRWCHSMFALSGIFGIRVWAVHKWLLLTTRLLFLLVQSMNCGCTPWRDTQIRNLRRVPRCSKSLQNSSHPPTTNNHQPHHWHQWDGRGGFPSQQGWYNSQCWGGSWKHPISLRTFEKGCPFAEGYS